MIDYEYIIPRDMNWEGDLPGQNVAELDIISHGRDSDRLEQSKDKSSTDETTNKTKQNEKAKENKKTHTQTLPLGPQ